MRRTHRCPLPGALCARLSKLASLISRLQPQGAVEGGCALGPLLSNLVLVLTALAPRGMIVRLLVAKASRLGGGCAAPGISPHT